MPRRSLAMHVCPACASPLMQHVSHLNTLGDTYYVVLRCPNCGLVRTGTFTQRQCDKYDTMLDFGERIIRAELDRIDRDALEHDVETFVAACQHDQVWPEDFQ